MAYLRKKNGVTFLPPGTGTRNNVVGENFSANTTERIFSSITIPANTFNTGDFFDVYTLQTQVNIGGAPDTILRIRIGTANTTSDPVVTSVQTGNSRWIPLSKRFIIRNQIGDTLGPTSATTLNNTLFDQTLQVHNIDWSKQNYLHITVSAQTTTQIRNVEFIKLRYGKTGVFVE